MRITGCFVNLYGGPLNISVLCLKHYNTRVENILISFAKILQQLWLQESRAGIEVFYNSIHYYFLRSTYITN